jgi:hypothetical protein
MIRNNDKGLAGAYFCNAGGKRNSRKLLWAPTTRSFPSGDNAAQDCVLGNGSDGTAAMALPVSASYTMTLSSSR